MTTLHDITRLKFKADETISGIKRLWLGMIVIASPSWHIDYNGLITYPPIDDYDKFWLWKVIGGKRPDLSQPAENILREILIEYHNRIIDYFLADPIDRDKNLFIEMQNQIKEKVSKINNH